MSGAKNEYRCANCDIPNCAHKRPSYDVREYYPAPNGKNCRGEPVQVDNCTITPRQIFVCNGRVFCCGSFKPMDAA